MKSGELHDQNIALKPRMSTAVYINKEGEVEIEQRDDFSNSYSVYFDPADLVAVVYAMLDAAGLPMELVERTDRGYCDVERPHGPISDECEQPLTAAERAKRYRQRKRDTCHETSRGERDASRDDRDAGACALPLQEIRAE